MNSATKLNKDIKVSTRIDKSLDIKMEAYATAKGVKYMRARVLVELADMMLEVIAQESVEYKKKIASMVKSHKETKLEHAVKVIDALDTVGLELKEKGGTHEP